MKNIKLGAITLRGKHFCLKPEDSQDSAGHNQHYSKALGYIFISECQYCWYTSVRVKAFPNIT